MDPMQEEQHKEMVKEFFARGTLGADSRAPHHRAQVRKLSYAESIAASPVLGSCTASMWCACTATRVGNRSPHQQALTWWLCGR